MRGRTAFAHHLCSAEPRRLGSVFVCVCMPGARPRRAAHPGGGGGVLGTASGWGRQRVPHALQGWSDFSHPRAGTAPSMQRAGGGRSPLEPRLTVTSCWGPGASCAAGRCWCVVATWMWCVSVLGSFLIR